MLSMFQKVAMLLNVCIVLWYKYACAVEIPEPVCKLLKIISSSNRMRAEVITLGSPNWFMYN